MKAVRIHEFGGPEVLRYEDVATPAPGPGQVLVRVRAAATGPCLLARRLTKRRRIVAKRASRPPPFIGGSNPDSVIDR